MTRLAFIFLTATTLAAAPALSCDDQQTALFQSYIQKRQALKLGLKASKFNVTAKGIRLDKDSGRSFEGRFTGVRLYSQKEGTEYLKPKFTGDKEMHDGPLWAPGPLKIFVEQDAEMNGPLRANTPPDQLSRINLKNYKLVACEMNAFNEVADSLVYRFHIAPRAETEGLFEGYVDADPVTLLTMAEVSKRTVLSDRARSNFGGRMTEFNFKRYYQIVDRKVSLPALFQTRAKSRWSNYSDVTIEARFELVSYEVAE
ncbi:MAG TPA: hypothetical protein VFV50_02685 [Bdellovibrionales bacterium]|nr:hypothetical protein [Bdellovibrionales bacterium]